ncbi:hypothetical protein BH09BAC1_BH09BAC1_13290 [soil metagenome]
MNQTETYRQWAAKHPLPLFHRPEWLDAVCQWEAVVYQKGNDVWGLWPLPITEQAGFKRITQPYLSPYLGPVLFYPEGQKNTSRIAHEKEVLAELINQLPDYASLEVKCLPSLTNGLAFHWAGFNQTTRYTYILGDLTDTEAVFSNFRDNVRREIRKAEKQVTLSTVASIQPLFELKKTSYQSKKQSVPFGLPFVEGLYNVVKANGWGQILEARDAQNNLHASVLLVWDHETMYYLLGAADPQYNNSGAMSLLLWQGIQLAAEKGLQFNFEGSMIPAIERFFSAFGGMLTPYHHITHERSKLLRLKKLLG